MDKNNSLSILATTDAIFNNICGCACIVLQLIKWIYLPAHVRIIESSDNRCSDNRGSTVSLAIQYSSVLTVSNVFESRNAVSPAPQPKLMTELVDMPYFPTASSTSFTSGSPYCSSCWKRPQRIGTAVHKYISFCKMNRDDRKLRHRHGLTYVWWHYHPCLALILLYLLVPLLLALQSILCSIPIHFMNFVLRMFVQ